MHNGKEIAKKDNKKVIECEQCGFKHLSPIPTDKELDHFYKKEYFNLTKKGNRAPEIRKQMQGGVEAKKEVNWINDTLYQDIFYIANMWNINDKSLLDIGCGNGELLKFMRCRGWGVVGIEPSKDATERIDGIEIYNKMLGEFILSGTNKKFSFISMLNVLEHVPNPKEFLEQSKILLKDDGLICIRVPNDFTTIQSEAELKTSKSKWWVAVPDHINYFNKNSLEQLLYKVGFDIIYSTTEFPMEMFILMGDNYVDDPKKGSICHKNRVNFEMSLPNNLRRDFNTKMSELGWGRNLLIFGKLR